MCECGRVYIKHLLVSAMTRNGRFFTLHTYALFVLISFTFKTSYISNTNTSIVKKKYKIDKKDEEKIKESKIQQTHS